MPAFAVDADWVAVVTVTDQGTAVQLIPFDSSVPQLWVFPGSSGFAPMAQDDGGSMEAAQAAVDEGLLPASYVGDAQAAVADAAAAAKADRRARLEAELAALGV
jgi:hypothetical protein